MPADPDHRLAPVSGDGDPAPARARRAWQVGTPVMFLLCGALFAISAEHSDGTDLRTGRFTDLASVVAAERAETNQLTEQAAELNQEVDTLSAGLGVRAVSRYQSEIEDIVDPAGLTPKSGSAVQVTLTDAPLDLQEDQSRNPNDLVVHQQDIQAVVNAMWRGGAVAVTVQGQRLVSTTGIKCEGNSVTLHGVPYSPPYVVVGIGSPERIGLALASDDYLQTYRDYVADPRGGVGYVEAPLPWATAPAYTGLLDLSYASEMADPQA